MKIRLNNNELIKALDFYLRKQVLQFPSQGKVIDVTRYNQAGALCVEITVMENNGKKAKE